MHSPTPTRRRRTLLSVTAALGVAALALAGCSADDSSDSSSSSGSSKATQTLTYAAAAAPVSLDPALQNVDPINNQYIALAYDPLIRLSAKGTPIPDLATSWKYLDDKSTKFQLTLRSGVKFNDGTTMTADDVVKSIKYMIASGVNGGTWLGKDTTVESTGKLQVLVTTSSSNSVLPFLLNQRTHLGSVISAKGLENTADLKSGSYGAGPYMLDTSATIANDTYVFVQNPNYWDSSKQHWKKVVIKIAGSASAALQAVENGDADIMRGDVTTGAAAASAGLTVKTASAGLYGVGYLDRDGEISAPMANVKVRQALSYAIDRKSITTAIWGTYGKAGNDLTLDGFAGFEQSVSDSYSYNPSKAKKLLTEAGYPDGFTFDMQTTNTSGADIAAQAIVENWKAIGVTAKLTVYSDTTQLITDTLAKKYAVGVYFYGAQQQYLQAKSFFNGGANQYNPFNSQDSKILADVAAGAAASSVAEQNKAYGSALQRAIVDLAWFSNVAYTPSIVIAKKGLAGLDYGSLLAASDLAWNVAPGK